MYNSGKGGIVIEQREIVVRQVPVITVLDALVPKEPSALYNIEMVIDYERPHKRLPLLQLYVRQINLSSIPVISLLFYCYPVE